MRRKQKFITTLFSLGILFSLLLVGVYSMSSRQVDVSGQIHFRGEQVQATVVVRQTTVKAPSHVFTDTDYIMIDSAYDFEIGSNQANKNFGLGEKVFSETLTKFSFKIEITSNMLGEAGLQVEYLNLIEDFPEEYFVRTEKLELKNSGGTVDLNRVWGNIMPGETAIWTVDFEVINPNSLPNTALAYISESFTIKRV